MVEMKEEVVENEVAKFVGKWRGEVEHWVAKGGSTMAAFAAMLSGNKKEEERKKNEWKREKEWGIYI